MGILLLKSRRCLGGKSEEECAHMFMVRKHLADYLTACVTVHSDSLSSIMAVSSSFPCLLLLLISSLSWASNRGSAFLMEPGGVTSSGRSPPSGRRPGPIPPGRSRCPSNINKRDRDAARNCLVDTRYRVLCQTRGAGSSVLGGACGNVYC